MSQDLKEEVERDQDKRPRKLAQTPAGQGIVRTLLSSCDPTINSPPVLPGTGTVGADGFHATGTITSPDNFASMTVAVIVHGETPQRYVQGRPYTYPGNGPAWDFLFPSTDNPPLPTNRDLTLVVTVNGRDGSSVIRVRDFRLMGGVAAEPGVVSAQMVLTNRIFVQYDAEMDPATLALTQNYALSGLPGVMIVPPLMPNLVPGQPSGVFITLSSAATHAFTLVINPLASPAATRVRSLASQVVLEDSPDHEEDIQV